MATATITVSGLSATPSIKGNALAWSYTDPHANGLPYLSLDAVEVHAASTNDRAGAVKVAEGRTDAVHVGVAEETTLYYWIRARDKSARLGDWYPSGSTAGIACTALGQAGMAFGIANAKLVPSVAGNALTVAVKTLAGADPSDADPVFIAFRSATLGAGGYVTRRLAAALSITVPSTATMGMAISSTPFRLWAVFVDDGGTVRLGLQNCSSGSLVYPISEYAPATSTAIDASAGSVGIIYTNGAAVSSKSLRLAGFLEWSSGLGTAGTWNALPDVVAPMSVGMTPPGGIVNEQTNAFSVATTGAMVTPLPFDDTVPQVGEGISLPDQISITPASKVNVIEFSWSATAAYSIAAHIIAAMFKTGDVSNAAAAVAVYTPAADELVPLEIQHAFQSNTTSAITFTMRAGGAAGTLTMSGTAGNRKLGGVQRRIISARELQG